MCCAYLLYLIIFIYARIRSFRGPAAIALQAPEMGEVRQVEAQGLVPTFKVGVSSLCGEILWTGWPYFNVVYGDTQ